MAIKGAEDELALTNQALDDKQTTLTLNQIIDDIKSMETRFNEDSNNLVNVMIDLNFHLKVTTWKDCLNLRQVSLSDQALSTKYNLSSGVNSS